MAKLLIIADDLTGALDTGVHFSQQGISVQVCTAVSNIPQDTWAQVLVVNSQTRHMPPQEAYRVVYDIIASFNDSVTYVYKKTDSALRGCVGAELTAASKAMGEPVAFVPALPRLGRTTVNGIQYINGVELAKSEFGSDPLEPMRVSYIPTIIAEQSDIPCCLGDGTLNDIGIRVYDVSTDEDIMRIATELVQSGTKLFAGCAGLAAALAYLLPFKRGKASQPVKTESFGVVCGSLNPTTAMQMEYVHERGFSVLPIEAKEFLREDFFTSDKRNNTVARMKDITASRLPFVLRAKGGAITGGKTGEQIADGLGCIIKEMLPLLDGYTLLITGGDTLMAFIKYCGFPSLKIVGELSSGIVCLVADVEGKKWQLVSKSGGFGEPELFDKLYKMLKD